MIKGIAASAGIAVSKVFKLSHPELVVEEKKGVASEEIEKFQQALKDSQKDIEAIKEKAQGRLAEEELAIFDAHLMFTQDPEFISQIEAKINEEEVNAEFAVKTVADSFIMIFESMDDPYFKERAADLKDVTYRIQAHLLNVNIPDLSIIDEEVVIVANDLTPSDTAQLNRKFVKGFATEIGGRTSHSAIMARSLEIPAVVGAGALLDQCEHGQEIILDAIEGHIILNPTDEQKSTYLEKAQSFLEHKEALKVLKDAESVTKDGRVVELAGNIGT
ncbi:MAG TPA: phosphoenolpyruvate-utilizing N-terminal domain-containing protein, partial [Erysipelothrix sp.]